VVEQYESTEFDAEILDFSDLFLKRNAAHCNEKIRKMKFKRSSQKCRFVLSNHLYQASEEE